MSFVERPSISRIVSPALMPAASAGEPSSGVTTLSCESLNSRSSADAGDATANLAVELGELVRGKEPGMQVAQRLDHAGYGALGNLLVGGRRKVVIQERLANVSHALGENRRILIVRTSDGRVAWRLVGRGFNRFGVAGSDRRGRRTGSRTETGVQRPTERARGDGSRRLRWGSRMATSRRLMRDDRAIAKATAPMRRARGATRCDHQQVLGVVGSRKAGSQHAIVAGLFLLGPHLLHGEPGERVVPVQGAGELREELRQAIQPPDVRQFVDQDRGDPVGRPACGFGRQ